MRWYLFSCLAALSWGLTYVLNEMMYRQVSIIASMAVCNMAVGIAMGVIVVCSAPLKTNAGLLLRSRPLMINLIASTLAFFGAEIFLALSITGKNAALASLIEISYPLFIMLFSWIFLRKTHLNWGVLWGAVLIFTGVALVILYGK